MGAETMIYLHVIYFITLTAPAVASVYLGSVWESEVWAIVSITGALCTVTV